LRHRLDGEGDLAVADFVDVAVERREADAKMGRIGLTELGDVVGDRAGFVGGEFLVALVKKPQKRRFRTGPGAVGGRNFHRPPLCTAITARATGARPAPGGGPGTLRPERWVRGWQGRAK